MSIQIQSDLCFNRPEAVELGRTVMQKMLHLIGSAHLRKRKMRIDTWAKSDRTR